MPSTTPGRSGAKPSPTDVFVIHGRNLPVRDSLFAFLSALGLNPIEWDSAVVLTGKPSPYVGEVLDTAFAHACALIVLLTGDDEAQLRSAFRASNDPPYESELTPQPRANVLFEAGMAFGRNADATILVQVGDVRPFSDIGGRYVLRFEGTPQDRNRLAERLRLAGCAVNTSGTRWLSEGTHWEVAK
ncbi:MAG: nucleotide-binding protein [Deltaproteobacteria bacterium]|nr:nucleotide-binding protein [Deltaproteobacteria bacterium]